MKHRLGKGSKKGVFGFLSGRRREHSVRGDPRGGLILESLENRLLLNGEALADLVGGYFNVEQSSLTAGENFQFDWQIKNQGDAASNDYRVGFLVWKDPSSVTIHRWLSGKTYVMSSASGPYPALAAGESSELRNSTLQLPNSSSSFWEGNGTYYIGVCVDVTGYTPESDVQNNVNHQQGADFDTVSISAEDTELPTVEFVGEDITSEDHGIGNYDFCIVYTDNANMYNGTTKATDSIRITGPNGYDYYPSMAWKFPTSYDNGKRVELALSAQAPGGDYYSTWQPEDNGTYTVHLMPNMVKDYNGNYAPGQVIGSFEVDIETFPPTAELIYPPNDGTITTEEINNPDNQYVIIKFLDTGIHGLDQYSITDSQREYEMVYEDGPEIECSYYGYELLEGDQENHSEFTYKFTYRSRYRDSFFPGVMNVNLVAGTFKDERDTVNEAFTQSFTILPDPTQPLAQVVYPPPDEYVDTTELNEKQYIDVTYTRTASSSINGDEIQLFGAGADALAVVGMPTPQGNDIYRYELDGEYLAGPVEVEFIADSFTNEAGSGNTTQSESFTSFPDIAPLQLSINQNQLVWEETTQTFTYSGTFGLGLKPSEGETFCPLVTVNGVVSFDGNSIRMNGLVSTELAGIDAPLFQGEFEYNIGTAVTSMLNEASGQLPNEYTLAGTELKLTKMEFVIPEGKPMGHAQMELQGSIKVPDDFGGFELSITDPHKIIISAVNGVSISGGKLTLPDLDIFMFGGEIKMTARDMSVEYIAAVTNPTPPAEATPAALRFRGTVALPYFYNATADFTPDDEGNDSYIEITELGGVDWYGTLSVEDIAIVPGIWELQKARLGMTKDQAGNYVTVAEAKLLIPTGIEIGAELGFVNGTFNKVQLEVDQLNKPIGTTGAFLQKIMGRVDHVSEFDTNPISFGGGIGLTAGPHISVDLPDWLGMGDKIEGSLVALDLEADLDENHLTGHGFLNIINGLAYGNANAELNWTQGYLAASGDFNALDGLLTANGSFRADSDMNISMTGAGTVTIPSTIPLWGGTELGSANVKMQYISDSKEDNDFFAGWGRILVSEYSTYYLTGGFRVNFDGSYSFLGAEDITILAGGENSQVASAQMSSSSESYAIASALASKTYQVAADTPWILIGAEWENNVSNVAVELTAPDGTKYSEAEISNDDQMFIVEGLSGQQRRVVYVHSPTKGDWTLTIPDSSSLNNLDFAGFRDAPIPEVSITAVEIDTRAQEVTIDYSASDADQDSQISIYYDTDDQDGDGILIADELAAAGTASVVWDTARVTAGTYYVYALAQDDIHPPVVEYWPQSLNIEDPPSGTDVPAGVGLTKAVIFTDSDDTLVTVKLANGQGMLSILGDNIETIEGKKGIEVKGDNLTLAAVNLTSSNDKTALTVTTKGGSVAGTTLGEISGDSLGKLTGKLLDLTGDITLDGILGSMQVDDIAEKVTIVASAAAGGFSLKADSIANDVEFDLSGMIKSFKAVSYTSGVIQADQIGQVKIKEGDFGADVKAITGEIQGISAVGDITGNLMANGAIKKITTKSGDFTGVVRSGTELGSLQAINLDQAIISAGDDIKKINLKGDILDSYIMAGYDISTDFVFGAGDKLSEGNVLSVTAKGTFARSYVAAGTLPHAPLTSFLPDVGQDAIGGGTIAKVRLGNVDYHNADVYFGLFAATEVKPFKIGKELAQPQGYFIV